MRAETLILSILCLSERGRQIEQAYLHMSVCSFIDQDCVLFQFDNNYYHSKFGCLLRLIAHHIN